MNDSNDQKGKDIIVDELKKVEVNRNFLQNKTNVKLDNKSFSNYKQNNKIYNTNLGKRPMITRRMNMRGKTGK